jgi:hypothetical protein
VLALRRRCVQPVSIRTYPGGVHEVVQRRTDQLKDIMPPLGDGAEMYPSG